VVPASSSSVVFQELFLQQLPLPVRAALANTAIANCRELAEEADTFFLAGQQSYTAALRPTQPTAAGRDGCRGHSGSSEPTAEVYRQVLLPC